MCRRQSFLDGLCEWPFQKEWITDVLSQLSLTQPSWKGLLVSHTTTSSITTASAQPMSQPCEFQPSKSFHAAQQESTRIPMPTEVDASTQTSRSRVGRTMSE